MATRSGAPLKLIALAALVCASAAAAHATIPALPFSEGTTWIYEGKVAWQEGTEVKSKRVRWETRIIKIFSYPRARVAVVRGFPSELAWYGDRQHPRHSLLVLTPEGLFEIEAGSAQDAHRLAEDFARRSGELMLRRDTIIPFPLSGGRRFRSRVKGFRPSGRAMRYREIHRTNPDHSVVDFVPGLGVVSYVYEHHGTVSSVAVELKEIRRRRSR